MREYTPENIDELPENSIFVFGSNTEGRHGRGAALVAKQKFGAIYGQSSGLQGRSYAIITKDLKKGLKSIPLKDIYIQLLIFLNWAEDCPQFKFYVTKLGSSLAGYSIKEIKSQFEELKHEIPDNVILPKEYEVRDTKEYFGWIDEESCIHIEEYDYTIKSYFITIAESGLFYVDEIMADSKEEAKEKFIEEYEMS